MCDRRHIMILEESATLKPMLKKYISAALVVVLMAWAEMAMSTMLAIQIRHMRPAHEMEAHMTAHQHAMPAGQLCCRQIRKKENGAPIEFAAGSLPCEDEHRCCILQGPQNLPAAVATGQKFTQGISLEKIVELTPAPADAYISVEPELTSGSPPEMFGMILRV